jgi:hypothetical protein
LLWDGSQVRASRKGYGLWATPYTRQVPRGHRHSAERMAQSPTKKVGGTGHWARSRRDERRRGIEGEAAKVWLDSSPGHRVGDSGFVRTSRGSPSSRALTVAKYRVAERCCCAVDHTSWPRIPTANLRPRTLTPGADEVLVRVVPGAHLRDWEIEEANLHGSVG